MVADMEVDMVADEIDDMMVDMEVDKVADMVVGYRCWRQQSNLNLKRPCAVLGKGRL